MKFSFRTKGVEIVERRVRVDSRQQTQKAVLLVIAWMSLSLYTISVVCQSLERSRLESTVADIRNNIIIDSCDVWFTGRDGFKKALNFLRNEAHNSLWVWTSRQVNVTPCNKIEKKFQARMCEFSCWNFDICFDWFFYVRLCVWREFYNMDNGQDFEVSKMPAN